MSHRIRCGTWEHPTPWSSSGILDSSYVAFNVHGETKAERERALATSGQHQPRPMPFDPAKLKGLSKKLIRSHWENNYGRAVTALMPSSNDFCCDAERKRACGI